MAIARISDIRGLVTIGGEGEEILKNRDLISDHGGILTISEFAKIIFEDGREVEVTGPVSFNLDSSFFNEGTFEDSITQISDLASLEYVNNIIDETNIEDIIIPSELEQVETNNEIQSEQLDTTVENNNDNDPLETQPNNIENEPIDITNELTEEETETENPQVPEIETPVEPEPEIPVEPEVPADTSVLAPTITVESTGEDSVYNSEELGADGTVTATISLPSDAAAGDILTINGENQTLTQDDIDAGSVTKEVNPDTTVTASITDAAGNTSSQASQTVAPADTSVLAPTITVESTGEDSVYNSEELGADGTVTATISLPSDAAAGDILTINGENQTLTQDDIDAGSVTKEVNPDTTVTASITDAAGNTSSQASQTVAPADTSVLAPTITVESTGEDSVYNSEELGADGTVTATISLPSDAAAGDILTINGENQTLTQDDIDAGSVTKEVNPDTTVTASITDAAGNTSSQASQTVAPADTSVLAPTITVESTGEDSVYNSEELGADGTVTATISLPSDAAAGDILTINGENQTLTQDDIDAGSVTKEVNPDTTVTASITDAAGNTSSQASQTVAPADTSVLAPTITVESTGEDSVYNSEELGADGTVTATISLPSDAAAGDILTINGENQTLTQDDIDAGSVTKEVNPDTTVTASITDAAGNTSSQASQTVAPADTSVLAPTITVESTGEDSVYNSEELGADGTVTATISLPSDAAAGDILTINGENQTLTQDDIDAGSVTKEVNPDTTVTASITDAAGNTSSQASQTVAPADTSVLAPTITVESTGEDSVYNSEELGADGTVTATISLPSDAAAGDILTINGENQTLTQDDIDAGSVTKEVNPDTTVTASITDAAGNTSSQASQTVAPADTSVLAPTITVESTGEDSVYNSEELGADGTVTATISLPSDAAAGDILTINGENQTLTQDDIDAGSVTKEVNPDTTVTASITDAAGNTSSQASQTVAPADTSVLAPTITVESTGEDSVYNSEELGADGTVTATISLPSDAAAGDILTINGENQTLTQDDIDAGSVTKEVNPDTTVTASITDAAGNTSSQASQTVAPADTSVLAPTITVESTGEDSVYNSEELGADGTVTATISLPSDAAAGDILTINGENQTLTQDDIDAGSVTKEVNPDTTVTASITDAAGNTSSQASQTVAPADTSVLAPTITVESTGEDSVYNSEELGADGTVTATISLPSDAAAGDILTINGENQTLTQDDIDAGSVTKEVNPDTTVTASITDAAGNTSSQASQTVAPADTSVLAPTITVESTGEDSVYNSEELGADGTVTATISLPSDAAAGDILTINGENQTLTQDDIDAGSVTKEVNPDTTVTASITDAAGNTSSQASQTVAPADTSVLAPTITVESTGEDSVYNSEELGADGTVTATISLPSDAAAGDILTINGENQTLTQDDIDAGSVTKEVNPDTTVTASITDAAGNTSSQASQTVAPADTSVLAPTITVESTGEDSVYNSEELGADGTVTATISLPSDAAAGDILTINGENQTLTQDDIDAGSVTKEVNPDTTVTASITDAAGNTSSQASQTVAPADTSVLAPTITVESTGEDSVYNSEELGADGTVTATISLPSDAAAGDILTINGENQTLTQDDIDAGSVTKEVNPDTTVTASITDAAGNTSSQASQTVAPADTSVLAPTITVESTGEDSVYNSEELGADGTVTATISLPSDAAAGDILTINGENQTLTQDDIDAGSVTKEVNPDTTVTASITDAAGNTSSQASQTVAPADTSVLAPTITVESTGEDSVYNSEELGADGTVTATISLPSDAAAGDILTINGENQTLTQDDIDAGSVTKEVNPDTTVTASITDAAGNTSSQASQTVAPADTSVLAPTITVESTGEDSVYNSEELGADGTVTATISLPSDAAAGDILTINGENQTLTQDDIDAGSVTKEVNPDTTVTASITDAAGNTSSQASQTVAPADTSVLAPTITVESTGEDSVYNSEELGADGTVTATISLPSDAAAGDILTINGENQTLTQDDIDAGSVTKEVNPDTTVTASITDAAGNTSSQASQTVAPADTSVLAPTITVESTGEDSVYNSEELGADGTVTATISLPSDAAAGDILTINGENQTLTQDDIDAGSVTKEVNPDTTVTASITDAAGNTSSQASQTVAPADTSVLAPTITVESTGEDSVYNSEELGADGTVTATISLPSDAAAGDILTINGENQTLTQDDIDAGSVTKEVNPDTTVTASITDAAGNTSSQASQTVAPADTSVLAPTITVESTGEDSVYNSEELGADGTVTATISLPSDAAAGDILTINGENQTLTQDDIDAGSVTKEVNPDTTVTASITDAAGNTSSQASQTVAPADTSVLAPTITVESTGEDSVYNSEELGADGTVTATISLPSDAAAGDILTINGENQTLTQDDIDAGSVTKEVNPDTTVTASITDAAGNTSSQASQTVAPADTSVLAPTITVESTGEDSVYNSEELGADGTVTATISLPSDAAAGDILTINGENQTLTQDDIDAGSVTKEVNPDTTVTASITDAAGNTSSQASQTVAPADTEATITVDTEFVEGGDGFTYDVGNGGRNANNINANSTEEALNVANGNNGETGDLVFGNVNNSSFNLDNTDDVFVVQGNANNVNLNLNGGDNTVIFEKNPGAININASYGDDVLVLPGNQNDYDFSNLNDNNGILSGQILGPNNTVITINNFDAISFGDGTSLGDSSIIPTDGNDVLEINGTTNDVEPGQTVKIVVTDENNNSIETTAIVQEDGTYSTEVDTDGLGGELSTSVEVFDKAGNKAENSDAISIDIEAGEPTVSIEVGDAIPTVIETEVVDSDANSEAGIYEKDGKFYQEQETSVVDVEALRELGYTMDSDGKFFKINEDDAKVLIEQEKTREVTKIVDTDPIMKEATETTTFETVGQAHVDEGAIVYKKSGVNFDFEQPTSNVELSFSNFDTGTAKVSFYDENGNQVGRTINTSHTNDTQGYSVPDGAVGVRVYNNTRSGDFEVDTISYRGESGEVTVEAGGLIPDYEAMAEEGIFWSNTESKNLEQTQDIKNIGNVGNGNVKGFNPEDHEQSQVFDFGTDMANRKVTITVDMQVKGSWDNNSSSTNDYFSVSANGQEIDVNHYSNRSWGHESDDVEYIGWDNKENFTYEYEVYLDENGQVQLDFMVASTASNEVVNIKNIEVDYEGETGWQKEVTETETYTESILVDAPAEEVDPSEIPGGIPYISDEVEVDPIMTTEQEVVEYTYPVDISAALSDVDGSESLSVMITNVPEGGELSLGTNNGDGTWTIEVPEGNTSISESLTLTVPDEMEDFELGVTATSYETVSDDINSVTDSDLVDIPADDELELDFNLLSSLNEDTQDEEESISEVTQLNLQDMLSSNGADESLSSLLGDESSESKSDSNSLENNEKNESSEDQSQVQSAFDKLQEASSNLIAQSENEVTIGDDDH